MRRWNLLIVFVLLIGISFSVYAESPSKYLNSRLTVLSSRLLQEISMDIDQDENFRYHICLLPLMNVNGENEELADYLNQQLSEAIDGNPFINLVSPEKTNQVWNELKDEALPQAELFQELGRRLEISGIFMASLVTHDKEYTIKALVINAKTGTYRDLDLIDMDRKQIDLLPYQQAESVDIPGIIPDYAANIPEIDQQDPGDENSTNSGVTDQSDTVTVIDDRSETETSPNDSESENAAITVEVSDNPDTALEPETNQISEPVTQLEEQDISSEPEENQDLSARLQLAMQSPLLDDLILGFDLGDLDGDGSEELVYSGGNYLRIRNLTDYTVLWTKPDYLPASNDHKILTVDLDKDGMAEVISHGNLVELVDDLLVSSQPRFISRPVSLYGNDGIVIFNQGIVYVANYQGLIMRKYNLGEDYGKRFVFADLDGDGSKEFVTTMQGQDEMATIKVFNVGDDELHESQTLNGVYGFAIYAIDLNDNGVPEIYLRRNFFDGDKFLYSKIYVLENRERVLTLISESPRLDYFIVDFSSYPKTNPTRLVVGGMYLDNKRQSIQEIKSRLFFYTLE